MRFLHTSDWHLGRSFHGASLLEEQAEALARMVELARIGSCLDEADDRVVEASGAAEGLVHIHPFGDVLADLQERAGEYLVGEVVAVILQRIRRVDLRAQH